MERPSSWWFAHLHPLMGKGIDAGALVRIEPGPITDGILFCGEVRISCSYYLAGNKKKKRASGGWFPRLLQMSCVARSYCRRCSFESGLGNIGSPQYFLAAKLVFRVGYVAGNEGRDRKAQ
jgi:hypothetical protein